MIIKKISIENWMGGTGSFEFGPGQNTLSGANGAGKTRVYSAMCWLFTGRDSLGRAEFEIKNASRRDLNRGDHVVEVEVDDGGKKTTLRRTYREVWATKRGSA